MQPSLQGLKTTPYQHHDPPYTPGQSTSFKISRSKIDLFIECPRCFYLDRRLGVKRPDSFPFTLNSAVDTLLKKEFDIHRAKGTPHPLMETYKIDAVPFAHKNMDTWRHNFTGVQYLHQPTNFLIFGAVDDIWHSPNDELIVVDYKATSKSTEVNIDAPWQMGYKRQMEVYQWLLRQNGFVVSDTGYFVYANGQKDKKAFDGKLEFKISVIPYKGSDAWIEGTIADIHKCLNSEAPKPNIDCKFCNYIRQRQTIKV